MTTLAFIKGLFALLLLLLFFIFFGLQSLQQYMAGKYQIVTEIVATDGSDVPAPTFTVVKHNPIRNIWDYQIKGLLLYIIIKLHFIFIKTRKCLENEKNMTCVEDLGERTGEIMRINRTQYNWKEDKIIPEPERWHRRFREGVK